MNDSVQASADLLLDRLGSSRRAFKPRIALLLGSGWAPFVDHIEDPLDIPYADLPAFPALAVSGHRAMVRAGRIGPAGTEVLVLAGRKHAYESGAADGMTGAIRTLAAAGVQVLLQTNAAGSLDPAMRPGDLMLVTDHLNLPQRSPLWGETGDARFQDMTAAYDPLLRSQALQAAQARGITLHQGVYAWMMGPQFETPAEIRMLQLLGAQAVGMSTVPETITARHAGLRVLALSMMTNMGAGMEAETLSHAHTLATATAAADRAVALLAAVVGALQI
ncbi:MAG: purine-nucleoside phosphorylase [Rubrivivax sp.]